MRIKLLALPIIFFFGCQNLLAQTGSQNSQEENPFAKEITARFNFLGLADQFDFHLSVGAEYKIKPQFSMGADVGWYFDSYYVKAEKTKGVLFRPFLRYYFHPQRSGFLEAQFHFKYVSYQLSDWIGRDLVDGNPTYLEWAPFHFKKRVIGFNIIAGEKFNLSQDKRLKLEVYGGLGIKFKKQESDNGNYQPDENFLRVYDPRFTGASLPLGMSLIYFLK